MTLGQGEVNVGEIERAISVAGGAALALFGLSRRSVVGGVLALAGADHIYRGVTGRWWAYSLLGISTATSRRSERASIAHRTGIKVEHSVTVDRPAAELFRFWRNFENLPRFMDHLESVRVEGDTRSHWVAKGPAGKQVEWDAEIINEKPNELIAWRTLEGADVPSAGSVHFTAAPGGRGTEVRVVLEYSPPGGKVGAAVAKVFGEEPDVQTREDLRRFKQVMEAGEIPTSGQQPTGR
jgi:uncharacterized membrane protein